MALIGTVTVAPYGPAERQDGCVVVVLEMVELVAGCVGSVVPWCWLLADCRGVEPLVHPARATTATTDRPSHHLG